MRSLIIAAVILLAAAMVTGEVAVAYDGSLAAVTTADAPAQQQRGEAELPWLFAVYLITWAAFFGYVFVMSRKQQEMQREIDTLRRALDAKMDEREE